ncbi:MAG TPA: MBL fold metallo-hydrolase [Solirubrobacteraceae bacterium]|jgi:glyoxylase-like metal-dependent hydrolase (beta-lactamase superfamily II)/ketosteroid isomerase-like protein|nr:MBL fold metallo-hydrolase [Solirubrobacteraceae bacterium]
MASSSVIAKRYFDALTRRDLEAAVACWAPGAADEVGVRFGDLFDAFPDLRIELLDTTTQRERCVVRWHATGTFLGPGHLEDFAPNGAQISIDGCDVLEIREDQIVAGDFYMDGAEVVQQLGLIPAPRGVSALANSRTWLRNSLYGAKPEAIAAGVWLLRGGIPRRMNVYLIEDDGGLTVFDSGSRQMSRAIRAAGARFGGIRRIVLSHADCDHRGGAAGIDLPIYCHPLEKSAAQSASPYRDYWNLGLLSSWARPIYPRLLASWDGGSLEIAGTVQEGDEIAGFKVLHLPGHAPGLIALYREEDGLALVSDLFYTLNPDTGLGNAAHVPHPAFNLDTNQARESIRRLATLGPKVVWPGFAKPVSGDDIDLQLQRAASAAV